MSPKLVKLGANHLTGPPPTTRMISQKWVPGKVAIVTPMAKKSGLKCSSTVYENMLKTKLMGKIVSPFVYAYKKY